MITGAKLERVTTNDARLGRSAAREVDGSARPDEGAGSAVTERLVLSVSKAEHARTRLHEVVNRRLCAHARPCIPNLKAHASENEEVEAHTAPSLSTVLDLAIPQKSHGKGPKRGSRAVMSISVPISDCLGSCPPPSIQ